MTDGKVLIYIHSRDSAAPFLTRSEIEFSTPDTGCGDSPRGILRGRRIDVDHGRGMTYLPVPRRRSSVGIAPCRTTSRNSSRPNPPATNQAVEKSAKTYTRHIDEMPSSEIVDEIDGKIDMVALERELMEEGIKKFAEPQHALLRYIAQKRASRLKGTEKRQGAIDRRGCQNTESRSAS